MKRFSGASIFGAGVATVVLLVGTTILISGLATGEAHSTPTLGKGDRLDIQSRGTHCSQQAWPYYETSCLRSTISGLSPNVRVVVAQRKI